MSVLLKKKYRQHFIDKNLKKHVDLAAPFVYFPMAVDLERNLLITAPLYTNQIEIIRNIAKSLPIGYSLYVKENPSQVSREWRSISEYKEIMSIPNVTIIHPSMPSRQLLQNCSLVITIAGSSGFEAAFYGKPTIAFANVGYSILPSIKKVTNVEQLSQLIQTTLVEQIIPSNLERYLILLEKNSFDFDLFGIGSEFKDKFYFGGTLVDVEILPDQIKTFLEEHNDSLSILALEHIKKIKRHKEEINLLK